MRPNTRHIRRVLRFSIALPEPCKDAKDLGIPLKAQQRVCKPEVFKVEIVARAHDAVLERQMLELEGPEQGIGRGVAGAHVVRRPSG